MPTDLRALVGAPAWRWMGGMWWRVRRAPPLDDITGRAIDRRLDDRAPPYPGALPDITDPATLGCMLALAREAWADPTLHVVCARGRWWAVSTKFEGGPGRETEGEALAAAILVASVLTHG